MSNEVYEQQISDIEKYSKGLSEWEESFVDSLSLQIGNGRGVSKKQADILERIYDEKVG